MKIISAQHRIDDCINIRREVFVCEQGVPEALEIDSLDEPDSGCEHFLILDDDGRPIGTFRAYYETEDTVHLQRFCILPGERKKGVGRAAFAFVESCYSGKGVKKITFGAQCSAIPFYEKCGCVCVSDVFPDAGIPHRTMEKTL